LRVQAKALLAASPSNEARAQRLLLRSCRIARRQSAVSWELRSAATLASVSSHASKSPQSSSRSA